MNYETMKACFLDDDDSPAMPISMEQEEKEKRWPLDRTAIEIFARCVPCERKIISFADHDIIGFLGSATALENFARNVTPQEVNDLRICGVFWSGEYDCLAMFV